GAERRLRAQHRAAHRQHRIPPGDQPLAERAVTLLALVAAALFESHAQFEKVGFYPLWGTPATRPDTRQPLLAPGYFEVGLGGDAQVGLRPQEFLFRAPNLHGKLRLLASEKLELAVHAEVLALLSGSTSTFTSSNFVSRIDNSRGVLWVLPAGATL